MKKKLVAFLCACLATPLVWAAPAVPTEPEQFQVREKTEVPNTTLQPGSYSIRILDHLRDRVVVQVSRSSHVESTFLAVPAATMANAPAGPIPYSNGPKGKSALKGFAFPGGVAVEFVYPKSDAVSIAQANDTKVLAIDPASEGRVAAPKLSQNDMQMITLWMLEPTRVGPNSAKPGIAAARYQAPAPVPPAPTELAQNQPVPPPPSAVAPPPPPPAGAPPAPRPARRPRPVQVAQNDAPAPPPPPPARTHVRPANVKVLPHTASALPLLWMGAFGAFALAGSLTIRRYRLG